MNKIIKNNIIIVTVGILGFFLYPSKTNKEDKLFFLIGYVTIIIVLIYLLNKPSKINKDKVIS